MSAQKNKTCSECGAAFKCGAAQKEGKCWCAELPNIMPLDSSKDCFCPSCLEKIIRKKITGNTKPL